MQRKKKKGTRKDGEGAAAQKASWEAKGRSWGGGAEGGHMIQGRGGVSLSPQQNDTAKSTQQHAAASARRGRCKHGVVWCGCFLGGTTATTATATANNGFGLFARARRGRRAAAGEEGEGTTTTTEALADREMTERRCGVVRFLCPPRGALCFRRQKGPGAGGEVKETLGGGLDGPLRARTLSPPTRQAVGRWAGGAGAPTTRGIGVRDARARAPETRAGDWGAGDGPEGEGAAP